MARSARGGRLRNDKALYIQMFGMVALTALAQANDSVPCSRSWHARKWFFGAGDCFPQSGFASELHEQRAASLACSQRVYRTAGTYSDPIGYSDGGWAESNPTCTSIEYDGETYLFTLAEPKNAISSFRAFDMLSCVNRSEFVTRAWRRTWLGVVCLPRYGRSAMGCDNGRSWNSMHGDASAISGTPQDLEWPTRRWPALTHTFMLCTGHHGY